MVLLRIKEHSQRFPSTPLLTTRFLFLSQGTMNFGYIVHHNQLGLHKIDLVRMERVALIDLTAYNCHPEALNFVAIGGSVVINCAGSETVPAKQLILDYLTDSVIKVRYILGNICHVGQKNATP